MANKKRKAHKSDTATHEGEKKKSLNEVQVPNWVVFLIIGLFIFGGVLWYLIWGRPQPAALPAAAVSGAQPGVQYASEAASEASPVEVLPQTTRNFGEGTGKNPFAADLLGEVRVAGTVVNSNGKSTAIVATADASYIVTVGDVMVDSSWEVTKITGNSVTFTSNGTDRIIYVDGTINSSEAK